MALKDKILEVIRGPKVAAIATIKQESGQFHPAVRYMVTTGLDDLTLIASTAKSSRKIQQMKENPNVAITIWSGETFANPYVMIQARAEIHEDLETKKNFWNPSLEKWWKGPEDPEFVVIKYSPSSIEYYHDMKVEVWKK